MNVVSAAVAPVSTLFSELTNKLSVFIYRVSWRRRVIIRLRFIIQPALCACFCHAEIADVGQFVVC